MMFLHSFLPAKQDLFQLPEIRRDKHPFFISHKIYFQMMEAEYHGQFPAVLPRILEAVFHRCAGHLAYRNDLRIPSKSQFVQLL